MSPKRYHPALVTLHWLLALLVIVALAMGALVVDPIPNSAPEKADAVRGHAIAGVAILVLTLIRLVVRLATKHPPPAPTGMAWADKIAPLTHWLLYGLVIAMAGSGLAMALMSGLGEAVFGSGAMPQSFGPARRVHGIFATLLMVFVALHIAAALYHQMIKGDGLFARMGFGKR